MAPTSHPNSFMRESKSRHNHSVEANRRPAAPPGVGSQFGSPSSARPGVPAAVAHLWRSTMEQEASRSNVRPQGSPCDAGARSASSGTRRRHSITTMPVALPLPDGAPGLRGPRALRDEEEDIPSNHSVEANRRPPAPPGAGHQFGLPSSAPPYFPAAVAHLWRSADQRRNSLLARVSGVG